MILEVSQMHRLIYGSLSCISLASQIATMRTKSKGSYTLALSSERSKLQRVIRTMGSNKHIQLVHRLISEAWQKCILNPL